MTRGRLFGRTSADEVLAAARDAACELVMPHKGQLTDALVDRVRAAGLKLATWVVDDPAELRRLAPLRPLRRRLEPPRRPARGHRRRPPEHAVAGP